MASRKPLVIVGGSPSELPAGDTLLAPAVDRGNGFVSWTGEATVTPATSVALVDSTGALLSPTKTYKVAACNIDSSAQRGAVALFVGNGSAFTLKTVYEESIYSSNVKLYLNAGVPSVSVYGGSGPYRIAYRVEEIPNFGTALSEFGILQRLLDAPSDGKSYVRKDGAWVEATVGGGGSMIYRKQATFTSSGTFTLPSTALPSVDYDLCGGGGSGGRHSFSGASAGTGGGGGERLQGVTTLTPGDSYSVVIGSGGAGVNTNGNGNDGGDSSAFGLTARGGKAGEGKTAPANGGASGAGVAAPFAILANTTGSQNYSGSPIVYSSAPGAPVLIRDGTHAFALPPAGIGYDGKCSGGGGAGGNGSTSAGGPGAGNGYAGSSSSAGNATGPGCGGGGLSHSSSLSSLRYSGSGFRGQLDIIYWDTVP